MKNQKILFIMLMTVLFLHADIKNRDKPALGEWDFRLEKVWEIDKAGDDVFGHPFSLSVSKEGTLYVFDSKNGANYIFDKNGKYIKSFAKGGQGPGEVVRQERIHIVKNWLIIPGMNGIHYFTKEGEYVKTVKQDKNRWDPRIFIDEENIISAPMTAVLLPEGKAQIVRKNLKTEETKIIADFSLSLAGVAESGGQVVDIIVIGLSPIMTLGLHKDRLYWGLSDSYVINVSDLDGTKINSFSVARKKRKASDNFKKEYFKNFPQLVKSFPDEFTFFCRIEVTNDLVYVFVPDLDLELGRAKLKQIDIFSLDGKYLYRAHVDFGDNLTHLFSPLRNLLIKDGFIYAVCEREDDSVVILKCKVNLPQVE